MRPRSGARSLRLRTLSRNNLGRRFSPGHGWSWHGGRPLMTQSGHRRAHSANGTYAERGQNVCMVPYADTKPGRAIFNGSIPMKLHGQRHCGAIAYEAEVEVGTMNVCHCLDCQDPDRVCVPDQQFRRQRKAFTSSAEILAATPRPPTVAPNECMRSARFAARPFIHAIRRIRRPIPCTWGL